MSKKRIWFTKDEVMEALRKAAQARSSSAAGTDWQQGDQPTEIVLIDQHEFKATPVESLLQIGINLEGPQ